MAVEPAGVLDALKIVQDPDLHRDIVSLGFIKDLAINSGRVSFTIELTTPACPVKDQMRDQARAAAAVRCTDVDVRERCAREAWRAITRASLPGVKNIIAVGTCRGVGKTTVTVNLSCAGRR